MPTTNGLELINSKTQSSKSMLEQLDKLLSQGFEFLDLLCKETPASGGDGKKLATLLLTYFKESPRKMLWVVLWATTKEVESTPSNETLFRESNVQTELMFGYFYTERGKRFLDSLLRPLINFILRHPPVVPSSPGFAQFQTALLDQLQPFVDRFVQIDLVPLEFQRVFRHMKKEINNKFPAQDTQCIILALFFLRVICPVIIRPEVLELASPTSHIKMFVECARVLQTLANGAMYHADDTAMQLYNPFLQTNISVVRQLFVSLTNEKPEGGVPENDLLKDPPPKKRDISKEDALYSILRNLQGEVQEYVAKEHRRSKGDLVHKFFMEMMNSPKWKKFKTRPDTETWTAKEEKFFAIRISGAVRASVRVLQTYIHSDHRIVNDLPNYIKGGLIKTHDDSHADFLVAYKFGVPRDLYFCKQERFLADNYSVSIAWSLEKNRRSEFSLVPTFTNSVSAEAKGIFKAAGVILKPLPENPNFCLFTIVFNLHKKTIHTEGLDNYMYKTIQKVRTETENFDIPSTNSTPLARSEALRASMPNLGAATNGNEEDLTGTAKLFARNSAEF